MRSLSIGLFLVAIAEWGCEGRETPMPQTRASTAVDSWLCLPPMEMINGEGRTVLARDQFAVVATNEAEALARLAEARWVQLTPDESKQLTHQVFPSAGGKLVLLRALTMNEGTGQFTVTWRAGSVCVFHGSLGHRTVPMARRAMVARLPALPSDAFAYCSMAE